MKSIRHLFLIVVASATFFTLFAMQINAKQSDANVLLAKTYQLGTDVQQYLVSEKFDGVRAVWDGGTFHTRTDHVIAAPAWFTKDLPKTPLDGELWLGHGKFEALSGAVRKDVPIDEEWRGISYMVFELPNAKGTFAERAKAIVNIVKLANSPHLKAVKQFRVSDEVALHKLLNQIVAQGGEGLMLHRANALYLTGRSDVLLKLKLLYDAEAIVVAHTAGQGKYKGKLGALEVETPEGIRFKLGTGFTDAQRENPPKIGSTVTYTYRDKTKAGKPKFASFLRVRNEQ
ncbi:DNA ligase [Methylotenera sp.]|uniref:DNA ligase n=1 Tax=Methylotenera sp. TaxID=2051956 RepID=UPI002489A00A|nr:DNA ligase [Methylotenera sp.]MDI1299200.1 DNA ligase [Methylotenera sp.]